LRSGESISVAAFFAFVLLGWLRRLDRSRQRQVIGLGLLGTAMAGLVRVLSRSSPASAHIIGDWLPSILLLLAYWQSGRFSSTPNRQLQHWLERTDERWIGAFVGRWERDWRTSWIGNYFEVAYFLCYALIPLGVAVLYGAHRRNVVDVYWATVLPPTLLCYLVIPFAPTIPPRLAHPRSYARSKLQSVNFFVLRHASIQLNTFPSAHVVCTVAASLVLLKAVPLAGGIFLLVSLSIAAGAVLGRYHYLPDVIFGALLSVAVSGVTLCR
jgi:membrane-associated phospholipid phosphatase